MSVLRLIAPNKAAIYYPFVLYNFAKSCQLILILRNCRPSSFASCLNCCHHNQALKFYKEINSSFKIGFKHYSHAKLSESNFSAENVESKIIYNSVVKYRGFIAQKRAQLAIKNKQKNIREVNCVALKYLYDESLVQPDSSSLHESDNYNEEPKLNLPYSIHGATLNNEANFKSVEDNKEKSDISIRREDNYDENIKANFDTLINDNTKATHKNWMFDYECYRDSEDLDEEYDDHDWKLNYGTSDPNIPVSQVPCGGCGALLHCQDPAIPGYLPVELFGQLKATDLRAVSCQRCHFLKEYNTALAINVDPNEYPKILSQIKDKKALVVLMVDMTDFPCSIWPGLLDIIGSKRPMFVVGNKIDLLQGDSKHWLERAQKALEAAIPVNAHVKHVSLISAKTGFGIEALINKLFNLWEYRGDVYLVGCTNVGKSTLFNALLQSDYCKVKAVDLLQRATTSPWPGTTLNLLKFPILRPEGWKLYYRTKRLMELNNILHQEKKLLQQQKKTLKGRSQKESVQLIGHVGRTFKDVNKQQEHKADPFSVLNQKELGIPTSGSGLDPNDKDFIHGHWLYDTPGTVQPDQIINLLTIDELMITLPKQTIIPRTFQIQPNQSLFIGGLGRLDYVSGEKKLKFTVCASAKLPITVCRTEDAAELYNHYVGTKVLGVPFGDESRMKAWPGLLPGQEFALRGVNYKESCADVVLSSAGWVAVTPGPQMICKFLAWTPQARGIHVRIPPVLPYAIRSHGNRISSTIAYSIPK